MKKNISFSAPHKHRMSYLFFDTAAATTANVAVTVKAVTTIPASGKLLPLIPSVPKEDALVASLSTDSSADTPS